MRIAILGTRGIPNHYGGFEQCAEYLALGLVEKGHEVIVYNSHNHPYQKPEWNGVRLIHLRDPEHKLGTAGQFIYDLNCIWDVRKRRCDIILQLGYTSSSIWGWLLPTDAVVTTNMDGLEWKRTKYNKSVRSFLLFAEKCGIMFSDHLISDSVGIQEYLMEKHNVESTYIPYGAHLFTDPATSYLDEFALKPFAYDLLIARLEPENSIEVILDGVMLAARERPFLVVGNHNTRYGEYVKDKYRSSDVIRFLGAIFDINKLNNLRYFSNLYFHGHTVGGTNPSLLEAMASRSLICAHGNAFNRHILGSDAFFFLDAKDVSRYLQSVLKNTSQYNGFIDNNASKIANIYTWDKITERYEDHFEAIRGLINRSARKKLSTATPQPSI